MYSGMLGLPTIINAEQPKNPSALIMVKNESYFLPFVLTQLEGYFDSFVIYDIGSTDNTREIIDWWTTKMDGKTDLFVRYLPDLEPKVQGALRNSMIVEGRRSIYAIIDGDELYKKEDLARISACAEDLKLMHAFNNEKRFGLFKRVELNSEMTMQYDKRRSHHRLYTQDAFWTGNHPGEVSGYKQEEASEEWYDDIICWHFHNALRSPDEASVPKRVTRKAKRSYHPGNLIDVDILEELPILRNRIEDFPVTPALERLWERRALKGL